MIIVVGDFVRWLVQQILFGIIIVVRGLCSLRLQEGYRLAFFEVPGMRLAEGRIEQRNAIKPLVRRPAYFKELRPVSPPEALRYSCVLID
jgi:hypothetical protein